MRKIIPLTFGLLSLALAGGAEGHPDEIALRQSYQQLGQAILKNDGAAILRTYASEFRGWGPRYEPVSRTMLTEITPGMTFKTVQVTPLKFERQGQDYRVTSRMITSGEYALGEQKAPFAQTLDTLDLWRKMAGRWQIVESRALSSTTEVAGQKQIMSDPAPLTVQQRQTLSAALRPLLRPIQPAATTGHNDLTFLKTLAAARVIGVGEGSHGTHEHFVIKARIFKALVEQYGFNTLAFESNPAGAEALNAYISGQSPDLSAAVSGLGFKVWRTAEIRDLLVWMRQYNASRGNKPALHFLAVDMQDPGGSAQALVKLNPGLTEAAAPFVTLAPYQINELVQNATKQKELLEQANTLVGAVTALPESTARRSDLLALARTVQQSVLAASGQGTRDSFMAENLLDALKATPRAKVMLWAHNGHVSKAPDALAQTGMGAELSKALGRDYRTIGQTFSGGTIRAFRMDQQDKGMQAVAVAPAHPDSVEGLVATPSALVMADAQKTPVLRQYFATPRPVRGIGQGSLPGAMGYTFEVLPQAYDVLIFTGQSSPAKEAN